MTVFVGYDPREQAAFEVAMASTKAHYKGPVKRLALEDITAAYQRPMERRGDVLWDFISDAPMSTEFAISRFFVPYYSTTKWALFLDGDVLVRRNLNELFALADPSKAVMVVKHPNYQISTIKKINQIQTGYQRKFWSSVMLFNTHYFANARLTLDFLNTTGGLALHQFCWLQDREIGELPLEWNWLVGVSPPCNDPAIVHYTLSTPDRSGHKHDPFADEWFALLSKKAA